MRAHQLSAGARASRSQGRDLLGLVLSSFILPGFFRVCPTLFLRVLAVMLAGEWSRPAELHITKLSAVP